MKSFTQLLSTLSTVHNKQIQEYLKKGKTIEIYTGEKPFVSIQNDNIVLCGHAVSNKLRTKKDTYNKDLSLETWSNFLADLEKSLVRLNHVGINYACPSIEKEIAFYRSIITPHGLSLYIEQSDDPYTKWYFIGDATNWDAPLFEVVLSEHMAYAENEWKPHFQIDLDTSLTPEDLEKLLTTHFGPDFIKWKLDITDYGIVLEMGMLCSNNGLKTYLGIGTNLRQTQYHREHILTKI